MVLQDAAVVPYPGKNVGKRNPGIKGVAAVKRDRICCVFRISRQHAILVCFQQRVQGFSDMRFPAHAKV